MSEPVLQFEHIGKSFFGAVALEDVSLSVRGGTVLGLIGENGAGKSTLMNILGGVLSADAGGMRLAGRPYSPAGPADAMRAGIAFIHQELNLFPNLSIIDNLFIDGFPRWGRTPFIHRRQAARRAAEALAAVKLDVAPRTRVERLTPGQKQLVEIAKALHSGARLIIFDEPTTSLTARETQRLFELIERLRRDGCTVLYISHNLGDVLRLADEIVVLRDGRVVQTGPRAQFTVETMIASMVGRQIDQLYPARRSTPGDKVLLAASGVTEPGIVRDISFELREGEVLGLFGLMGSGRSELARILFGLDPFHAGTISLGGKVRRRPAPRASIAGGMAFITEDRREEGLLMEASVADNLALVALPGYRRNRILGTVDQPGLRRALEGMCTALRVKCVNPRSDAVKSLSGGNQQKTVIGKWLLSGPAVCIMDEPTRGIDVGAKHEVYSIINDLAARGTGLLCISSELEELMGICDRILVMSKGRLCGRFQRGEFDQERILAAAFEGHLERGPEGQELEIRSTAPGAEVPNPKFQIPNKFK
ncbi:MAG: sugar ABC transporter ATP-binding protein [Planctomycetes bacterium]|nr:sugar ABC transporter ATP-binding protein [Planctomycetota bacterium]